MYRTVQLKLVRLRWPRELVEIDNCFPKSQVFVN